MSWLRFEKGCPVAMFGRTPRVSNGLPDVLGIDTNRHLLEIEIKRSVSDFKANERKLFHQCRNAKIGSAVKYPKQFWFLTPHELTEKVIHLVPEWAGLMRGLTGSNLQIEVVKKAPVNHESQRLTTKECVRLARCMANQIYGFAKALQGHDEWMKHNQKWITQDYEI